MKVLKQILNFILAIMLCVLIICGFLINLLNNTLLNKDYVLDELSSNEYYEKVEVDIENEIKEYKYKSGLPEDVFDNLYTINMIKQDINSIIDNIYDDAEISNSSETVKENISGNIELYLYENDISITKEQETNIEKLENVVENIYSEKINLINEYAHQLSEIIKTANNIIGIAVIGVVIAIVVILALLIFINIDKKSRFISFARC